MTPDLIAQVLDLSLPVRLALLDADPNGAGWWVYGEAKPSLTTLDMISSSRRGVTRGAAFLPCNPLAIVEHAARLKFSADYIAALDSQPGDGYCAGVMCTPHAAKNVRAAKAFGQCPHTAAIALLREVVG